MKPLRNHSNALALLVALVAIAAALAVGVTAAHATTDPSEISMGLAGVTAANTGPVDFYVEFPADVDNVDATDFDVSTTGTAAAAVASVEASQDNPDAYIVTVDHISGDGDVSLVLLAANDITFTDSGDPLDLTSDVTSDPFAADNTAPQVDSFTESSFSGGTLHFSLHTNEDVENVNDGSFDVDSTGNLDWNELNVSTGATNSDFDVAVDGVTGSGTFTVTVNGWAITDMAGNDLDLDNGVLSATYTVPDTTGPAYDGASWWNADADDNHIYVGETLDITVFWDEPVVITGHPRIPLQLGSGNVYATYADLGYDATYAVFSYTVQPGDLADGITIGELDLNGGTIRDAAHNDATGGDGGTRRFPLVSINGIARPAVVDSTPVDVAPAPAPAPAPPAPPADTTPPAKVVKTVVGTTSSGKLAIDFGAATDAVAVQMIVNGKVVNTTAGGSITVPATLIAKPGKLVVQLVAVDAAGNPSDPVTVTLTRAAAPAHPGAIPDWAWQLDRWQSAPAATRGSRPHTPATLPAWYAKWQEWHRHPVTAIVG